jgi:hypothetical protein
MASKRKLIAASGDELAGIRQVRRPVLPDCLRWRVPQSEHTGTRGLGLKRTAAAANARALAVLFKQVTSREQREHSLANRNVASNTSLGS